MNKCIYLPHSDFQNTPLLYWILMFGEYRDLVKITANHSTTNVDDIDLLRRFEFTTFLCSCRKHPRSVLIFLITVSFDAFLSTSLNFSISILPICAIFLIAVAILLTFYTPQTRVCSI